MNIIKNKTDLERQIEDGEYMYHERTFMPEEIYDAEIILTKRG